MPRLAMRGVQRMARPKDRVDVSQLIASSLRKLMKPGGVCSCATQTQSFLLSVAHALPHARAPLAAPGRVSGFTNISVRSSWQAPVHGRGSRPSSTGRELSLAQTKPVAVAKPASSCPCHYFVSCELPSGEDLWCRTTRVDRGRADRCRKLLATLVAHQACTFDALQDRLKGLVQLAAGTTFQDFQQQLAQRVGLPAAQLQVVIACSRANEFDQLQKIPIHEGTVSFRGIKCRPRKRNAASWCLPARPTHSMSC